jgi:hypothetical protein
LQATSKTCAVAGRVGSQAVAIDRKSSKIVLAHILLAARSIEKVVELERLLAQYHGAAPRQLQAAAAIVGRPDTDRHARPAVHRTSSCSVQVRTAILAATIQKVQGPTAVRSLLSSFFSA